MYDRSKHHWETCFIKLFTCYLSPPEKYVCEYCGFKTHFKADHHSHLHVFHTGVKNLTQNIVTCYNCEKCDFYTYSLFVLTKHTHSTDHGISATNSASSKTLIKRITRDNAYTAKFANGKQWFKCEVCVFTVERECDVYQHILAEHGDPLNLKLFKCEQCAYVNKCKALVKKHIDVGHCDGDDAIWYECEQCSYRTKNKWCLNQHNIHRHHRRRWLQCVHCTFKTKYVEHIKCHIQVKHENLKSDEKVMHQCEQCPYKTATMSTFRSHVRWTHGGAKNSNWFTCGECGSKSCWRVFVNKRTPVKRTKSGEIKCHKCEHCRFKTKYAHNLKTHCLRMHMQTNFKI